MSHDCTPIQHMIIMLFSIVNLCQITRRFRFLSIGRASWRCWEGGSALKAGHTLRAMDPQNHRLTFSQTQIGAVLES